jgi:hypothetical protein
MRYVFDHLLPLEVETRNKLNKRLITAQAEVVAILEPFLNKKVRKMSGHGGWTAKVNPLLEDWYVKLKEEGFTAWLRLDCSSLNLEIATTYKSGESMGYVLTERVKGEAYVGRIDRPSQVSEGILTTLAPAIQRKTDYTVDWVKETQAQASKLEEQARFLRSELREFEF